MLDVAIVMGTGRSGLAMNLGRLYNADREM